MSIPSLVVATCFVSAFFFFSSKAVHSCDRNLVSVETGTAIPFEEVLSRIRQEKRVLIGERHGVAGHPNATSCLLEALSEDNSSISLVVEHIRKDQQDHLDSYRRLHPEVASGLGKALKWWETGWPAWKIYQPLFDTAWQQRIRIYGGDIPNNTPPQIVVASLGAIKADVSPLVRAWGEAMNEAHCGLTDTAKKQELGQLQVVRDRSMSEAMQNASTDITVLYAGRGHVRKDRGIPQHLGGQGLVIALWETRDGEGMTDRAKVLADAKDRYDFIWFVGETSERPVCARLRQEGVVR